MFACDCNEEYEDQASLDHHQVSIFDWFLCNQEFEFLQRTNCRNRLIKCSFCPEHLSSTEAMRTHLLMCGNKTDQCPICRQFVRRAIFAYHYENECANPDEPTSHPDEQPISVDSQENPQNKNASNHRKQRAPAESTRSSTRKILHSFVI